MQVVDSIGNGIRPKRIQHSTKSLTLPVYDVEQCICLII